MALRHWVLAFALLPLPPKAALANPVPDEVAAQFRDLVSTTARLHFCPNPTRLAGFFGSFGFDLLSPEHVAGINRSFGAFAPALVSSQGTDGVLHFEIQELYRAHANRKQREAMIKVLRHWLADDIRQAPRDGSMQIAGPESAVREAIDVARVTAAEMLSDWGDRDAIPLIEALEQTNLQSELARRRLRVARARFDDPCAGRLVRIPPTGPVQLCGKRDKLVSATVHTPYRSRRLTPAEVDRLWGALGAGSWDVDHSSVFSDLWLTVELADGSGAKLQLAEPGRLNLTEDSTSNMRLQRTMTNSRLSELIREFEPTSSP